MPWLASNNESCETQKQKSPTSAVQLKGLGGLNSSLAMGENYGIPLSWHSAAVAELADATDSKSVELIPRVGSSPTSGTTPQILSRGEIMGHIQQISLWLRNLSWKQKKSKKPCPEIFPLMVDLDHKEALIARNNIGHALRTKSEVRSHLWDAYSKFKKIRFFMWKKYSLLCILTPNGTHTANPTFFMKIRKNILQSKDSNFKKNYRVLTFGRVVQW